MSKLFGTALMALALAIACPAFSQGVPEIPDPTLNDIAMATMTPRGPVIVYNPLRCAQMGPLACEFFRAHEYGHVRLGHGFGRTHPAQAEMEADCFAAQNASPPVVQGGIQFFVFQGMMGDPLHGTGFQRARRVQDFAMTGQCHW